MAVDAFAMGAPKPSVPSAPVVSNPAPTPVPVASDLNRVIGDISSIASNSSCASYSWKNRGRAPASYINGMALTFAKSLCRYKNSESTANLMASRNSGKTSKDVLAWYQASYDAANMSIDSSNADTLRSLYTLGIGLGMRESSGKYCEGYDVTAKQSSSATAEAGMFQTSYNSVSASVELANLYNEYKQDQSKCYLNVFKPGVSCTARAIYGTGEGAKFQTLAKTCPAFAAEYAMISLRVLRAHYGPINRKEAELRSSCNQMLDDVQSYVDDNRSLVCGSL